MATVSHHSKREIAHYFEYSNHGVDVLEDGLKELRFGEFLVERGSLTREQLFKAMMYQDINPGVRIGECAAALGFVPYADVDRLHGEYTGCGVVDL